uniref:Uncharacterized protein n=1 Tax=Rhizophora mucronata TaxID=61149 RepID=A0A2P2JG10_RHIMU
MQDPLVIKTLISCRKLFH